MKPGATQLTLMLNGPSSIASVFVIPLEPRLGGRVVRLAAVAERRGRGDQHHLPGLLLDHLRLRRADGVERCLQMRVDDGVPVLVAHLEEHVVADDPGARDEDVERAAVQDRGLDRGLHVVSLRHAQRTGTADRPRGLLRHRLVEVGDDHGRSLAREQRRRGGADALRAAGDQSRLPLDLMRATLYGGHMEFRDILARRRMHRAFLPDPLPREQIERIANVIRRAPSGGFSQGGSIVVVTDDEQRHAIAAAFGDDHYSRGGRNFIADAPVHMIVSANESLYHAATTSATSSKRRAGSR